MMDFLGNAGSFIGGLGGNFFGGMQSGVATETLAQMDPYIRNITEVDWDPYLANQRAYIMPTTQVAPDGVSMGAAPGLAPEQSVVPMAAPFDPGSMAAGGPGPQAQVGPQASAGFAPGASMVVPGRGPMAASQPYGGPYQATRTQIPTSPWEFNG